MGPKLTVPEKRSLLSFTRVLWTVEMMSLVLSLKRKSNMTLTILLSIISKKTFSVFVPLPCTACSMKIYAYLWLLRRVCVLFLFYWSVYHIYIWCSCMCKWDYLVFLSVYSELVYQGYTRVGRKVHRLKSSYNDVISAVDNSFDQWGSNTMIPVKEIVEQQEGLYCKINPIWSYSIFGLWTFQPTLVIMQILVNRKSTEYFLYFKEITNWKEKFQ